MLNQISLPEIDPIYSWCTIYYTVLSYYCTVKVWLRDWGWGQGRWLSVKSITWVQISRTHINPDVVVCICSHSNIDVKDRSLSGSLWVNYPGILNSEQEIHLQPSRGQGLTPEVALWPQRMCGCGWQHLGTRTQSFIHKYTKEKEVFQWCQWTVLICSFKATYGRDYLVWLIVPEGWEFIEAEKHSSGRQG